MLLTPPDGVAFSNFEKARSFKCVSFVVGTLWDGVLK